MLSTYVCRAEMEFKWTIQLFTVRSYSTVEIHTFLFKLCTALILNKVLNWEMNTHPSHVTSFPMCLFYCSVSDMSPIPQETLTQGSHLCLCFSFFCSACRQIPEEREGKDGHQLWSLQDVHDGGSSCQGEEDVKVGVPSCLCSQMFAREPSKSVCMCSERRLAPMRGQSQCPCLPINHTPQGLSKLLKHSQLAHGLPSDATRGSSESVILIRPLADPFLSLLAAESPHHLT